MPELTTVATRDHLDRAVISQLRSAPKAWNGIFTDDVLKAVDANTDPPNTKVPLATVSAGGRTYNLTVIVRVGPRHPTDFSVILQAKEQYQPDDARLLRINGPHIPDHRNKLDKAVGYIPPMTAHAHYATERYLRAEQAGRAVVHDGFALRTRPVTSLVDALRVFARRANVSSGQLPLNVAPDRQDGWPRALP
ncbi:MAG: hypothetical protein QNJ12_00015 [Ilumatobacter sp.]|uniref:hypothetical protein n=1 Tax=Ilumatobacter sp. TaxID=1967498 RepID=UPI00263915EC|nr:hypothetical protein [Ilumatobacter sp.]MDJ0767135.1 hypothetical protein [Ilumatobacter sp.]